MSRQDYHTIDIPAEARKTIQDVIAGVHAREELGEITANYSDFVDERFKQMGDVAGTLHHAATGVSGEGGEILDCSKKVWVYGQELDLANMLEELGDLRFYYQKCLNMLGLTDADVQALNKNKLVVRYPLGTYTDEHAKARLDKQAEAEEV